MRERITKSENQRKSTLTLVSSVESGTGENIRSLLLDQRYQHGSSDELSMLLARLSMRRFDPRDKAIVKRYFTSAHLDVVDVTGVFILSRIFMFTPDEKKEIATKAKELYSMLDEPSLEDATLVTQRKIALIDVVGETGVDGSRDWFLEKTLRAKGITFRLLAHYYNSHSYNP